MAVEGIIANGVTEILKKLSSVVANEITMVWEFNDDLKNLQSTLNMIMAVMEDAEKKQLSSKIVRLWMEDLKAIAYDAEDVWDEYSYEVIRRRREKEEEYKSTVLNKVSNVFSVSKPSVLVNFKLGHKLKKINGEFNKIAKRKNDLGLQTVEGSSSHHMMKNRVTDPLVVTDWKVVGRENDKSNLIKMLLDEEENSSNIQGGGKHVSVIPIVGMGGLGKTTLAQEVYNDEDVQTHFQLKIWVHVSHGFDIQKLWNRIATSISIGIGKEDIATSLQNAFIGKRFLLVLDDLWNEKATEWSNFKKPFMVGRKGSKILVTTRNEKIALLMVDRFPPYPLGILNENDGWSLFKEIAFESAVAGAVETPILVELGKEMVKRCGGLPLAVIFLGSLMRSKKKEEEWKIIRDTKVWHESHKGKNSEILPSLRLSYDYLPSHLKYCFSYCCLFPKGWCITREQLIRLWMAEGFLIESPGENAMSMEEIGDDYFHSLLSSFFFQDAEKDFDGDNIATCKMHDLVHDLAQSVFGKNECLIVENAYDIDCISEETRRLNLLVDLYDEQMLSKVLEALKKAKKLRTIICDRQIIGFDVGKAFKENKRLRVLDFSRSHVITESASFPIDRLKYLRYLAVRGAYFPKGSGRLSFLQTLIEFNVDDKKKNKNACGIEEFEGLNLLRGDLCINCLQNVTSGIDACRANLKEKKNLRGLALRWGSSGGDHGNNNHEAVLEELRPHPNLRTLKINDFYGSKLPRWMEDSSCLPNLVELLLHDGRYIEQVAGFGALPSLGSLSLVKMDKLKCIGNEFYYSAAAGESSSSAGGGGKSRSSTASSEASTTAATTTIAFPSLKELSLESMPSLKEWVVPAVPPLSTTGATTNCFPLLEKIAICACRRLTTITPTTTIFPSLKVLILRKIDGRAAKTLVTNNLHFLTCLRLHKIYNLVSLPHQGLIENNNTLLSLEITCCRQFEGFLPLNREEVHHQEGGGQQQLQQISQVVSSSSSCSSLRSLKIYNCPALWCYPDFGSLTSLRVLEIQEESESLLTSLPSSLEHLAFFGS